METHNGEDETKDQDHDNDGVDAETRGLVGVEFEHGVGGAAGAGRASRGWSLVGSSSLSFLVGASTKSGFGTTGNWCRLKEKELV